MTKMTSYFPNEFLFSFKLGVMALRAPTHRVDGALSTEVKTSWPGGERGEAKESVVVKPTSASFEKETRQLLCFTLH